MDELISKKKLIRDLMGIKDMLVAAGFPFLAGVINRAIGCVENQPVVKIDGDLVEVVRCKDCGRHGKITLTPDRMLMCVGTPDCGYCHDAIRKEWKSND